MITYQARELAGLTLWELQQLVASRRIPTHYDEAEPDEGVARLREMGRPWWSSPAPRR